MASKLPFKCGIKILENGKFDIAFATIKSKSIPHSKRNINGANPVKDRIAIGIIKIARIGIATIFEIAP
jgi:hypothetical protein